MQTIILAKHSYKDNNAYLCKQATGTSFDNVVLFLLGETGGALEEWLIEFLNNNNETDMGGDVIVISKDGEYAILESLLFGQEEDPEPFKFKINNLIDLLIKWKKIYLQFPDEIIISYDGNNVNIIGKNKN